MKENSFYSSRGQISERIRDLKKVIDRLQKHGPLLEKQRNALVNVVSGMEEMLEKQAN